MSESENTFTAEEVSQLETEHRRVAVIPSETGEFEIIVGPAERLVWKAFRSKANKDEERDEAQETLVMATIVAIAYKGAKTLGRKEARLVLDALLKDWAGCTDGKKVLDLLWAVNVGVGARRAKS